MISTVSILQSDDLQLLSLTDPIHNVFYQLIYFFFSFSNVMILDLSSFSPIISSSFFQLTCPHVFSPLLQVSMFFFAQIALRRFVCLLVSNSSSTFPSSKLLLLPVPFSSYSSHHWLFFHKAVSSLCSVNFMLLSSFNFCKSDQFFVRFCLQIRCLNPSISECNHSYDRRCYKSLTTVYEPTQVNLMHLRVHCSHIALP